LRGDKDLAIRRPVIYAFSISWREREGGREGGREEGGREGGREKFRIS
jgi:hypothetical protein